MERKRTYVSMIYLLLLIIVSFIIRLIPHRNLLLAAYDEYLHRDLTLRIAEGGIGAVSRGIYRPSSASVPTVIRPSFT